MAVHWQGLDLTESAPVKACISITAIIHVGDKALIVLRFYTEIAVATAKVTTAFRCSDDAVQDTKCDGKRYRGIPVSYIATSPLLHADSYPVNEVCFRVVSEFKM